MKDTKPKKAVTFTHTRRAIKKIKEPTIRDDFAEMLYGVEFSSANGKKRLALKCSNALVAMAIGLNRTISPTVATGILAGLLEDGKQDAMFRRLGINYDYDMKCINAECMDSKGHTCITIDGTRGCGNKFGFQFPWRVIL